LVGLFLAILELIKNRQVDAEQLEPFDEIWLRGSETADAPLPPASEMPST
jgi:chromatin segregation and condensation protein Rec8/ScpA/Scc1 (kleisin family)